MKTMNAVSQEQMELSLEAKPVVTPTLRRAKRFSKARWWFAQMHRVVDQALDWRSAPPGRPCQGDLKFQL